MDTNALKMYYPSKNWNYSYDVIKQHMTKNGFQWLQGSVYVSLKPMYGDTVSNILSSLVDIYPWLNKCMRDCRQANIGKEHSLNHLFDIDANIPKREKPKESGMVSADLKDKIDSIGVKNRSASRSGREL